MREYIECEAEISPMCDRDRGRDIECKVERRCPQWVHQTVPSLGSSGSDVQQQHQFESRVLANMVEYVDTADAAVMSMVGNTAQGTLLDGFTMMSHRYTVSGNTSQYSFLENSKLPKDVAFVFSASQDQGY